MPATLLIYHTVLSQVFVSKNYFIPFLILGFAASHLSHEDEFFDIGGFLDFPQPGLGVYEAGGLHIEHADTPTFTHNSL